MEVAENKRLIESFFEAGNRGDLDGCLGLLDERVTWTNIGSTRFSGTFVGKQAVIKDLLRPVFGKLKSGIRSTVHNIVGEHDFVVAESRGHAETADRRQYDNTSTRRRRRARPA
jgi:ketosteroid isomerase-like protein